MLIQRLGMTETAIMIYVFAIENNVTYRKGNPSYKNRIQKELKAYMNWLYSTAGYYDKNVTGTYFNFNSDAYTTNFVTYINLIRSSLKDADRVYFMLHSNTVHENIYFSFRDKFNFWLGTKTEYCIVTSRIDKDILKKINEDRWNLIYDSIKNKNILIVSPFGELIQQQILNGNAYKANKNISNILSIDYITPPYCFGNNGPKNNALETLEDLWDNIKEKSFDIVLLSCGSYGPELSSRISKLLKKDAIYVGSQLSTIFGLLDQLTVTKKLWIELGLNIDYMIDIPEKYRPKDFMCIENGCYW